MTYDYLIVGAGLFGSAFAYEAGKKGHRCLVLEKRNHIGGNLYTENKCGINVHMYGPHIFHTSDKEIWDYINAFADFNPFVNQPLANYKGKLYHLPFNMNTFYELWGTTTPQEAKRVINVQTRPYQKENPENLEDYVLSTIGNDLYQKLVKGYTEKQWGRKASELPAFLIKRLPLRWTYDNNYFNDRYQGIPIGGYTAIIEKMLNQADVQTSVDFFDDQRGLRKYAHKLVYTGMIDRYYDYRYGKLDYRSLRFQHEILECDNFQGNAVINYTDAQTPYTRIIEHKHFEGTISDKTVITKEYPQSFSDLEEPYYPINNFSNNERYNRYKSLTEQDPDVLFRGRLGQYRYYNMDEILSSVLTTAQKEFNGR